jgi:hypothetical protein
MIRKNDLMLKIPVCRYALSVEPTSYLALMHYQCAQRHNEAGRAANLSVFSEEDGAGAVLSIYFPNDSLRKTSEQRRFGF